MATVVVDSRVRIGTGEVPAGLEESLRGAFSHENPKRAQMQRARIRGWWNEPKVIETWRREANGSLSFPRGGMSRIRTALEAAGVECRTIDRRACHEPDLSLPDSVVDLWPHQARIVEACLARENCLVKSPTASGKTSALLAMAGRLKVPTLVLVHSLALADQWAERAEAELGTTAGRLGGGRSKISWITVGIPKTVTKAADEDPAFAGRWGAVLFDEVHLAAARSMFACVDRFPARYRIGVSDDQRRKDRLEFLVHDAFGQVAVEVSDQELVDAGRVMDVEVLVVPTSFRADWYGGGGREEAVDYGRLLSEIAASEDRNAIVDRILAAELAEGRQAIVFAREREHCRSLASMAQKRAVTGFLIGGPDYRKEFEHTKNGFRSGEVRVAVGTYQACGTGIDLPSVEVGIAAAPCLANRQMFRQARGRVARRPSGKTVARLYVLADLEVFGLRHLENAARWNSRTFVWDAGRWVPAKDFIRRARVAG